MSFSTGQSSIAWAHHSFHKFNVPSLYHHHTNCTLFLPPDPPLSLLSLPTTNYYIIIIFQSSTRTLERTGPCCPFVIDDNNNFHIFSRVALGPRPRPARPEHKTQSHNFPRRQQRQRRRGPEKSGQGPSQILCCENCGLFESDTATACDSAASSTDCVCLSCDWWCANVVRLREMSNGTHSQPASQLCTCNSLALLFSLLLFRPYIE